MRVTATQQLPESQAPPADFRIWSFGELDFSFGRYFFTQADGQKVIAHWQAHGNDLAIDYEHRTFEPVDNGPVPAAGFCRLEIRGDGLWAVDVKWSTRAAELLSNREYRYYSPVFNADDTGHVYELLHIGLTNTPATRAMTPLVARRDNEMTTLQGILGTDEAKAASRVQSLVGFEAAVLTATGQTSTDAALGVIKAGQSAVTQVASLQTELAAIRDSQGKAKKASLIAQGKTDGKLTTALEAWANAVPIETLEGYLVAAPVIVPQGVMREPASDHALMTALASRDVEAARLALRATWGGK